MVRAAAGLIQVYLTQGSLSNVKLLSRQHHVINTTLYSTLGCLKKTVRISETISISSLHHSGLFFI